MIDYREVLSSFAELIERYNEQRISGLSHGQALETVSTAGMPEGTQEAFVKATEAIEKLISARAEDAQADLTRELLAGRE